jgi:hypothetical protein
MEVRGKEVRGSTEQDVPRKVLLGGNEVYLLTRVSTSAIDRVVTTSANDPMPLQIANRRGIRRIQRMVIDGVISPGGISGRVPASAGTFLAVSRRVLSVSSKFEGSLSIEASQCRVGIHRGLCHSLSLSVSLSLSRKASLCRAGIDRGLSFFSLALSLSRSRSRSRSLSLTHTPGISGRV